MSSDSASPGGPAEAKAAAKALLAFWRAAGVDMEHAEAVYAAAPIAKSPAPARPVRAPAAQKGRSLAPGVSEQSAAEVALAAQDLAALKAAVQEFDGCALKATARNTVFSDGVLGARVLLIGEAPGRDEDEQGKPFVGRSGRLLDRMLAQIGLSRTSNLLISNTIFWRPPGNRDPTQGETAACMPFVERLIALAEPELLILTGKVAAQTVLQRGESVTRMRGRRLSYNRPGLPRPVNAMVMLHPAYLLRRPQEKRLAWADLLFLEAWAMELGLKLGPGLSEAQSAE